LVACTTSCKCLGLDSGGIESFNVLNYTQFFGPSSVSGILGSSNFGQVIGASSPRSAKVQSGSLSESTAADVQLHKRKMAESEGFEPPIVLRLCLISSQVHSTGLCQLSCFSSLLESPRLANSQESGVASRNVEIDVEINLNF
jgi:hypothetical protein